MKVKIIVNGTDGWQFQRLDDDGNILSVRPSTREEYQLFLKLDQERRSSASAYALYKDAQARLGTKTEELKESQAEANALEKRVKALERQLAEAIEANITADDERRDALARAQAAEDDLEQCRSHEQIRRAAGGVY